MESVWHAAFRIVFAVVSQVPAMNALLATHLESVRNAAQSVFIVVSQIHAPPAKMATEFIMKSVWNATIHSVLPVVNQIPASTAISLATELIMESVWNATIETVGSVSQMSQIPAPPAELASHLIKMGSVWHAWIQTVLTVISQISAPNALRTTHFERESVWSSSIDTGHVDSRSFTVWSSSIISIKTKLSNHLFVFHRMYNVIVFLIKLFSLCIIYEPGNLKYDETS